MRNIAGSQGNHVYGEKKSMQNNKIIILHVLNARCIYLKLGLIDPAFIQTRRLFEAWRLFIKCIFQPFIFIISMERGLFN